MTWREVARAHETLFKSLINERAFDTGRPYFSGSPTILRIIPVTRMYAGGGGRSTCIDITECSAGRRLRPRGMLIVFRVDFVAPRPVIKHAGRRNDTRVGHRTIFHRNDIACTVPAVTRPRARSVPAVPDLRRVRGNLATGTPARGFL